MSGANKGAHDERPTAIRRETEWFRFLCVVLLISSCCTALKEWDWGGNKRGERGCLPPFGTLFHIRLWLISSRALGRVLTGVILQIRVEDFCTLCSSSGFFLWNIPKLPVAFLRASHGYVGASGSGVVCRYLRNVELGFLGCYGVSRW